MSRVLHVRQSETFAELREQEKYFESTSSLKDQPYRKQNNSW